MTSKVNITVILSDHFKTFRDEATEQPSWNDYAVMIGLPFILALVAFFLEFTILDPLVGTLISVFAIFAGLLFNVLVLIYGFTPDLEDDSSVRNRLLSQSFANISYSIIVSLLIVGLLTVLLFVDGLAQRIIEAISVFFSVNFFLSLLMVLKRLHILLSDKFGS